MYLCKFPAEDKWKKFEKHLPNWIEKCSLRFKVGNSCEVTGSTIERNGNLVRITDTSD